jgi:hypothetical protein
MVKMAVKGHRNCAFKAHNSVKMEVRMSAEKALALHFLRVGSAMLGLNKKDISEASRAQRFRDNFKWGPGRLAFLYVKIYEHPLLRGLDLPYQPKHLLWTFFFLFTYATERRICVALNADRKTVRKVTWPTIMAIASLSSEFVSSHVEPLAGTTVNKTYIIIFFIRQIRFENRKIGSIANTCVHLSVDCTDFSTVDWKPFDPSRFTYKFHGPGLRYEVAISIAKCYIVHIRGPFLPGKYADLTIARTGLHHMLPRGEWYLADRGYRSSHSPAITFDMLQNDHDKERMKRIRGRHETINRRFKEWGILSQKYRHDEDLHCFVFNCVAVLVQIDINQGHNVWQA